MSLGGRNVLVVAARVAGLSIARALAKAGARVLLYRGTNNNDSADLGSVEVIQGPLETVADGEALVAKCWSSFGPLGGLVVVPTEASPEQFTDTEDEWQAALHAGLKIPFFLVRAVAGRMEQAQGGSIVLAVPGPRSGTGAPLPVNEVTRSASETMARVLAKSFSSKVRICAVFGSAASQTGEIGTEVQRMLLFLLGEESVGSGTIVQLDALARELRRQKGGGSG